MKTTAMTDRQMIEGLGLVVTTLAHYFAQREERDKLVAFLDVQTAIFQRDGVVSPAHLAYFRHFVEAMRLRQMHSALHRVVSPEQGPN